MNPLLQEALAEHGAQFAPRYRGYLSDHGPMATLALDALGASGDTALDYLQRYRNRLEPAAAASPYLELRAGYLDELRSRKPDEVLRECLPGLITGWARDAYHPLIRLACGYAWSLREEMASGLAYLALCGPEPAVAEQAGAVPERNQSPAALLEAVRPVAAAVEQAATFTDRFSAAVAHPHFRRALFTVPDNLARLSRAALDVFAASHDFFALHLVTGAHAYRLLYPFAGPDRDAVFTMGIAGGYVAAGAPPFPAQDGGPVASLEWLQYTGDDEHRIKLAWSARAQAQFYGDAAYTAAAARYLLPRAER